MGLHHAAHLHEGEPRHRLHVALVLVRHRLLLRLRLGPAPASALALVLQPLLPLLPRLLLTLRSAAVRRASTRCRS